jgi:hypothetical protein
LHHARLGKRLGEIFQRRSIKQILGPAGIEPFELNTFVDARFFNYFFPTPGSTGFISEPVTRVTLVGYSHVHFSRLQRAQK